jgi:hypothetical protein
MLGSGCKATSAYVSGVASFVYRISLLPSFFRLTWAASGFGRWHHASGKGSESPLSDKREKGGAGGVCGF